MSNCIGSTGNKHCLIECPPKARFFYFNYKSIHSLKLLAVADANCCFTLIDVAADRGEQDNSAFSDSSFGKAFSSGD
jgi:hypothetical protein